MQLLTTSGTYAPFEHDCESLARLEVYRLTEDEVREIEEQAMRPAEIMEFLDLATPRCFVEPGAWYLERSFVDYDDIKGILIIEVRKSLNI